MIFDVRYDGGSCTAHFGGQGLCLEDDWKFLQIIHVRKQPRIPPYKATAYRKTGLELEKYRYKIHYIQETI